LYSSKWLVLLPVEIGIIRKDLLQEITIRGGIRRYDRQSGNAGKWS
jgi:hypothetical protein